MLHLEVQKKYFEAIKAGVKRIEGRLGKEKYLALQKNDRICFSMASPQIDEALCCVKKMINNENIELSPQICEIIQVSHYRSFKEMLEKEGLEVVLPGLTSIAEGVAIYRGFYSESDEALHGVAALSFLKLDFIPAC